MKKYEIAKKKTLTAEISQISVYAPLVAAKAKAGQFIILRVDEEGERIPLTISSAENDLVTVIFQKIGGTTLALDELQEGDCLPARNASPERHNSADHSRSPGHSWKLDLVSVVAVFAATAPTKKNLCRAGETFPSDPGQAWERAKKKGTACPDGRTAHLFRAQEAELRERPPKKRESRHGVHTHAMPAERLIGRIRPRDRAFPACGLDHGAQGISVDARHQFPVCLHRCQGGQKA